MSEKLVISDISDVDADEEPIGSPKVKSSVVGVGIAEKHSSVEFERRESGENPRKKRRGRPREKQRPIESAGGWSLFISEIHSEAKEEDVFDSFAEFGDIRSIFLNLDKRTGYLKGSGTVIIEKLESARKAKHEMHGKSVLGKKISVDWAFVEGECERYMLRYAFFVMCLSAVVGGCGSELTFAQFSLASALIGPRRGGYRRRRYSRD